MFLEQEANTYMQYRELHGEPRLAADNVLNPAENYREVPDGGTAVALSSNVVSINLLHEMAIAPQQYGENQGITAMRSLPAV